MGGEFALKRESSLIKNTIILTIGNIFPQIASLIILPILTACLTKEEYGTYDLISVLVSLLLPAATLQIETAAFRFLIETRKDAVKTKKIISTVFAFVLIISLICLAITWFVINISTTSIKILICLYFFIDIIFTTTGQIARGLDRNKDFALCGIVVSVIKTVLIILSVNFYGMGLNGTLLALLISTFTAWIILSFRIKIFKFISIKSFDFNGLKALLNYSWPMVPNALSMWVMRLSDRMVVTFFMGITWNAVYAASTKIPALIHLAQRAFTLAWQENASIVSKDKDANMYYSCMHNYLLNLVGGFLCVLMSSMPFLFKLFIRGDYRDAYIHIPILLVAEFFYALATFLGGIYVAYMKTKSVGITTTIAALINLIIDLFLIKHIGLFAASISTFVSYALLYLYRLIDIKKYIKIQISVFRLVIILIFSAIAFVSCLSNNILVNILAIVLSLCFFAIINKDILKNLFNVIRKYMSKKQEIK